jgi:hypothetical protein
MAPSGLPVEGGLSMMRLSRTFKAADTCERQTPGFAGSGIQAPAFAPGWLVKRAY